MNYEIILWWVVTAALAAFTWVASTHDWVVAGVIAWALYMGAGMRATYLHVNAPTKK